MNEQVKPFACNLMDCGMSFTNEDHLNVHRKKHDMILQFDSEQKSYVADQTPTPTRFIRNCEEVGLFQELQNVNPFDEGFKKAMETRPGILLEHSAPQTDDVLHTPQNIFPNLENTDSTFYSSRNTKNITISRSSSDDGTKKGFETITKCTNEVTISRVINKDDVVNNKEVETVSFSNNVIKINNSNDGKEMRNHTMPPIMSQKSLERVFDSLDELNKQDDLKAAYKKPQAPKGKKRGNDKNNDKDNYEVLIKLPTGKMVRMKEIDDDDDKKPETKELLKNIIKEKQEAKAPLQSAITLMQKGTLIPVTLLKPVAQVIIPQAPSKVPIKSLHPPAPKLQVPKVEEKTESDILFQKLSKRAAVKRYRDKLKVRQDSWKNQIAEQSKQIHSLIEENAVLKELLIVHVEKCPIGDELRNDMKTRKFPNMPVKLAPAPTKQLAPNVESGNT